MSGLITVPADQERIDRNMRREAHGYAVVEAVVNCEPDDRIRFLEAILEGLRAGMPRAAFGHIMDEANFWAERSTRAERKAYCAACYAHLSPADQAAFQGFIQERAAA